MSRTVNGVHPVFGEGKCSGCGCERPNALWCGHEMIWICWGCALEVLPSLIADAVLHEEHLGDFGAILKAEKDMIARFRYCMMIRMAYRIKELTPTPEIDA